MHYDELEMVGQWLHQELAEVLESQPPSILYHLKKI